MSYGERTPFILIARLKVKRSKLGEYKKLAIVTDRLIYNFEPGMLHHTFDQDPDDDTCFTWSEVYENDAAFVRHLSNPGVVEYLKKHGEWGESFSVEVYGTVGRECRVIMEATKLPVKIYETYCGYSRFSNEESCCSLFFVEKWFP